MTWIAHIALDLARRGVSDSGQRAVLAAAQQEAAA